MAADIDRAVRAERYDALTASRIAELTGAPRVELYTSVGSTMDVAHELASRGAAAGTLVIADEQRSGRGRGGKKWSSPPRGIWLTLIERPRDTAALDVLSLRVGLAAARALDAFTAEPTRLKWPNDIYLDRRKLAGALAEARWRGDRLDWVAIGLGVNTESPPSESNAAGLEPGSSRIEVLRALIPELRARRCDDGSSDGA